MARHNGEDITDVVIRRGETLDFELYVQGGNGDRLDFPDANPVLFIPSALGSSESTLLSHLVKMNQAIQLTISILLMAHNLLDLATLTDFLVLLLHETLKTSDGDDVVLTPQETFTGVLINRIFSVNLYSFDSGNFVGTQNLTIRTNLLL